jgi:hypothetical protein
MVICMYSGCTDSKEAKARRARYKGVLRVIIIIIAMGSAHHLVMLLRRFVGKMHGAKPFLSGVMGQQPVLHSPPILTAVSGGVSGP